MTDKKRNQKVDKSKKEFLQKQSSSKQNSALETFDDVLDAQMNQTIAAVVQAETYPSRAKSIAKKAKEDDTQVYHSPKVGERYNEDPYTVAQNYIDRVQFRL